MSEAETNHVIEVESARSATANKFNLRTRLEFKLELMCRLAERPGSTSLDDCEFFSVVSNGYSPASSAFLEEKRTATTLSLFAEVMRRDGAARVTLDRKWSEVASGLHCNCFQGAGMALKAFYEFMSPLERDREFTKSLLESSAIHESGARQAGLPPMAITKIELDCLGLANTASTYEKERYLDCRNHILQLWCMDCTKRLDFTRDILRPLEEWFGYNLKEYFGKQIVDLFPLRQAFFIVDTLGFMNWGCVGSHVVEPGNGGPILSLPRHIEEEEQVRISSEQCGSSDNAQTSSTEHKGVNGMTAIAGPYTQPKHIIVIGAGLAGLTCALQLLRFGHQVTLIEARKRPGGRIHTDRKTFGKSVDLGAMLITGVQGHPATVLCHQLDQPIHHVSEHCPIYSLGDLLDEDLDSHVENRFNDMLTSAAMKERAQWTLSPSTLNTPDSHHGRKKGRKRDHATRATHLTAQSKKRMSKYSGVFCEDDKYRVALVSKGSGQLLWLDRTFEGELDAARFHDDEVVRRRAKGEEFFDALNSDLYPLDFVSYRSTKERGPVISVDVDKAKFGRPLTSLPQFAKSTSDSEDSMLPSTKSPSENVIGARENESVGLKAMKSAQRWVNEADMVISRLKRVKQDMASSIHVDTKEEDHASLMERLMQTPEFTSQYRHISPDSKQLENACLSWHVANLEYACASSLYNVSSAHWDQDDEHDWEGAHVLLPNGFGCISEGLKRCAEQEGARVVMGKVVRKIEVPQSQTIVGENVKLTIRDLESDEEMTISGDACVCTVSLGVLKDKSGIEFAPPLPDWKQGAIDRLGFGNLNKVVLEFDSVFWDDSLDIFGRVVHPSFGRRGECYMFWCLNRMHPGSAIVLALVAGDAAEDQEVRTDESVKQRAVMALRETFPKQHVPEPKAFAITRWRSDPFARGSYSYVAVGGTGQDYSLLAEECFDGKLFFAGEATCREHPATTGGAVISGLREAAKIVTKFGRVVGEGLAHEGFDEMLVRLRRSVSVESVTLPESKVNFAEMLLGRLFQEKRNFARKKMESDFGQTDDSGLQQLQEFTPFETPVDLLTSDRARAIRANDILSRLPKEWNKEQALWYVAERLGTSPQKIGEPVSVWI